MTNKELIEIIHDFVDYAFKEGIEPTSKYAIKRWIEKVLEREDE